MSVRSPPPPRRRLRRGRVLLFLSGVLLCLVYALTLKGRLSAPRASEQTDGGDDDNDVLEVNVREATASNETQGVVVSPENVKPTPVVIVNRTDIEQCIYPPSRKGEYPEDLFSVEQRRQGWVVLHVLGMTYMFVALAIVCDEFFVPALEVITVKMDISDDVAGATFMAAGGSAPELFTSLIGVFVSHSNVGIGTIVGSAVFNILFVIGMCAIASREMLHLTWWPLFRDVTFYIVDLIMLIVFFLDSVILWWESVLLVLGYVSYVSFMKFNGQIERAVKSQLNKHMSIVKAWSGEEPEKTNHVASALAGRVSDCASASSQVHPVLQRGGSSASLHNTSLRSTIFQLMIHTLDPLGEAKNKVKPLNVPVASESQSKSQQRCSGEGDHKPKSEQAAGAAAAGPPGGAAAAGPPGGAAAAAEPSTSQPPKTEEATAKTTSDPPDESKENDAAELSDMLQKDPTPSLHLYRNNLSLVCLLSCRRRQHQWAAPRTTAVARTAVGETVGISEEIMGLTILAAGTSIPDLITSVIVARKGLGDMAVSSSVGSNIFDITVGLPVPWLIYTLLHDGKPVAVSSNGLFCAIVLLFLMLLFVIISIAACRWRMSRMLGLTMFVLYFVFLVLSVLLEDRVLVCPVSV
ncbi:putative sodium/potassium/calcium exchanger 1-like [Scophthalmus maximus]|uniref:Sodium/potassium/calcium exchanger 1 n=1 Tax=Scophthalmus maximus TaxID=52904 RepID=A0A2U9BB27_SCOMX|nr:putative sodium/potassium/calcium exchanger 1-like [Scophthalmus maximus]